MRLFETAVNPAGAAAPAAPPVPAGPDPALAASQNENLLLKLQNARLQALADFPQADREILEMVQGTPEEIRAAAEKLHIKAVAAANAQQPAPPAPAPAPAPAPVPAATAPVPAPGPGVAAPPEDQASVEQRRLRLQVKSPALRKTIEPVVLEEFFSNEFNGAWNKHIEQRKNTAGRTQ